MKHPLIIGAGGVASYLLPVLIKSFRPEALTIVDKDKLEARNLDRQMFSPVHIGKNKAVALTSLVIPTDSKMEVNVIEEWFSDTLDLPADPTVIICVADNHAARRDALAVADKLKVPCVIGGNEYLDNEAYIYYPMWKGDKRDPRVRHPEIVAAGDEGSPLACTGVAQIASPQLAIANSSCAAKILHLLWTWEVFARKENLNADALNSLPYELFSGLSSHTTLCHASNN